jgi:hypothetical protein
MHTWEVWQIPLGAVGGSQGFVNQGPTEGLSEVGLPHSSDEGGESRWGEGGSKSAFPEVKH